MTSAHGSSNQRPKYVHRVFLFSRYSAPVLRIILSLASASLLSGCLYLAYEKELFSTDHVRVVHSEQHCKDVEPSARPEVPNADLLISQEHGLGYFVATKTAWEVLARQLATELDGDISLIRPCDGKGPGFQFSQIQVWRTRGFSPIVNEESPPLVDTLAAPIKTTYGVRLQNIFDCLEQSSGLVTPLSVEEKTRPGSVDATEFFSSDRYFPGYAKIDRNFRPTRTDGLRLSMIESDRFRADKEAGRYLALSRKSRSLYAEQYLTCLLDRGYTW